MSDLLTEHILSLAEAARVLPSLDGRHPHPSTVFRWTRGFRGVALESLRVGRRVVTSREAIERFVAAVSRVAQAPQAATPTVLRAEKPKRRSEKDREAAIRRAEARLAAAGI